MPWYSSNKVWTEPKLAHITTQDTPPLFLHHSQIRCAKGLNYWNHMRQRFELQPLRDYSLSGILVLLTEQLLQAKSIFTSTLGRIFLKLCTWLSSDYTWLAGHEVHWLCDYIWPRKVATTDSKLKWICVTTPDVVRVYTWLNKIVVSNYDKMCDYWFKLKPGFWCKFAAIHLLALEFGRASTWASQAARGSFTNRAHEISSFYLMTLAIPDAAAGLVGNGLHSHSPLVQRTATSSAAKSACPQGFPAWVMSKIIWRNYSLTWHWMIDWLIIAFMPNRHDTSSF